MSLNREHSCPMFVDVQTLRHKVVTYRDVCDPAVETALTLAL